MSAKMEVETVSWEETERIALEASSNDLSAIEIEALLSNIDEKNLIAPLREAQAAIGRAGAVKGDSAAKRREALALQEQWNKWLVEREVLREEIKRGKECLEQVREELAATRARLEDWAQYEKECGKNPLARYIQALGVNERLEKFLPEWITRREDKLASLGREMEFWGKENGIQDLF